MKKVVYQAKNVRIFLAAAFVLAALVTIKPLRTPVRVPVPLLAAEAALTAVFLALPRLFFPVYKLLLIATGALGTFLFTLISLAVFYLILTPIAVVLRLFGKSFMDAGPDPSLPSYFEDVPAGFSVDKQY